MAKDLDRRRYDILRLIDTHGPIGSIRLVSFLQRHGYSIKGRTVRLTLANLDENGLTEKIAGKGRKLTDAGRSELQRGNVSGRLEQIRDRIATLTSQVTYDPVEDTGELIATATYVPKSALDDALKALAALPETPLGPLVVNVDRSPPETAPADTACIYAPSSITLDGVLLSRGIDSRLQTAGLAEYHPRPDAGDVPHDGDPNPGGGGSILRYTDAISGTESTMDVVSLLVESGRTSVQRIVTGESPALLVVDNREFPLVRYEEARDLAGETRNRLGGVLDLRKPRESGPFPRDPPNWEFASLTYAAMGETVTALLAEEGYAESWETLFGLVPRSQFDPLLGEFSLE